MPVRKYRSVEEMPRPEPAAAGELAQRIRTLWRRARLLAPPPIVPRGVTRFRNIAEANAARDAATVRRMKRSGR